MKPSSQVIFLSVAFSLRSLIVLSAPTSMPAKQEPGDDVQQCKAILDLATHSFEVGCKKGEQFHKEGGKDLTEARVQFTEAVATAEKLNLAKSNPHLYATTLGREAWFKANIDKNVSDAESELKHALQIDGTDALLHAKLAWILTDKYLKSGNVAANDRQEALDETNAAIKLDPTMPEPYYILGNLNPGHVSNDELANESREFVKRADNVDPEIFLYNNDVIKGCMMSRQEFASLFPTTQKSETP